MPGDDGILQRDTARKGLGIGPADPARLDRDKRLIVADVRNVEDHPCEHARAGLHHRFGRTPQDVLTCH